MAEIYCPIHGFIGIRDDKIGRNDCPNGCSLCNRLRLKLKVKEMG